MRLLAVEEQKQPYVPQGQVLEHDDSNGVCDVEINLWPLRGAVKGWVRVYDIVVGVYAMMYTCSLILDRHRLLALLQGMMLT